MHIWLYDHKWKVVNAGRNDALIYKLSGRYYAHSTFVHMHPGPSLDHLVNMAVFTNGVLHRCFACVQQYEHGFTSDIQGEMPDSRPDSRNPNL